jgi:hypothetical protein
MKKLIFFLAGGFFLFQVSPAFAQLALDKREIKLEAKPGERVSGSVTVINASNKDVTLKTYCEDFAYKTPYLGFKTLLPLGSTEYSLGKWITLATPVFLVPAKGKQEVQYTINVPKDAKGGYYGVLFFEKGEGAVAGEKGIGIIEKIGCSFFLETTDKVKNFKLDDVSVGKDGIQGVLYNLGNVILISQGTFYIMDAKGIVADRGNINKYYLPPGEKASFTVKVSNQVLPGKYTLVINFDMEAGKALIKEVDFSKDNTGSISILAMRD